MATAHRLPFASVPNGHGLFRREVGELLPGTQASRRCLLHLPGILQGPPSNWFKNPKTVKGHFGCVNAAAFSKGHGTFLATAGDDSRVLIWNAFESLDDENWLPAAELTGHVSNIFCVEFDASGRRIFSTGNDGFLMRYDIERLSSRKPQTTNAETVILAHEQSILRLSISPTNDEIVLTAGMDGSIRLWDMRAPSTQSVDNRHLHDPPTQMQAEMLHSAPYNYVEFNPSLPHLFVSSDNIGGIFLHDMRIFSSTQTMANIDSNHAREITHKHMFQYTTRRFRNGCISKRADITSAVWSPDGAYICAMIQNWYPTLYKLMDPHPLCVFKTDATIGQQFKCLATVKTPCFSESLGETFVFAGSDDLSVYGWKVPDASSIVTAEAQTQNSSIARIDTSHLDMSMARCIYPPCTIENKGDIVFYDKRTRVRPVEIPVADVVLRGHRSIINTVVSHPTLPYIVTAGVEKCFRIFAPGDLYGPIPKPPAQHTTEPNPTDSASDQTQSDRARRTRRQPLTIRQLRFLENHMMQAPHDSIEEDPRVILYFDDLITRHELDHEQQWRPIEHWTGTTDTSDWDSDPSSDNNDDNGNQMDI